MSMIRLDEEFLCHTLLNHGYELPEKPWTKSMTNLKSHMMSFVLNSPSTVENRESILSTIIFLTCKEWDNFLPRLWCRAGSEDIPLGWKDYS